MVQLGRPYDRSGQLYVARPQHDFDLLVRLKVFNTEQMNQAVLAFRRYEDASLCYTGIESHEGLTNYGLYDTVVAKGLLEIFDANVLELGPHRRPGVQLQRQDAFAQAALGAVGEVED